MSTPAPKPCVRWTNGRTGEIKERHHTGVETVFDNYGNRHGHPWENTPLEIALAMVPDLMDAIGDAKFRGVTLSVSTNEEAPGG